MDKTRSTLKRSILTGSVFFILILCVTLGVVEYRSSQKLVYAQYEAYMGSILHYIAEDIDVDDLANCIQTGQTSSRYDALQKSLDRAKERLPIHFIYIIIPLNTEAVDNVQNVMAGVRRAEERDDNMVHAVGLGLTIIDEEMRDTMAKNEALAQALSLAEEASRAKTAFLSNMSREIRTPMNAIIGFTALAEQHIDDRDRVLDDIHKISASGEHLLSLINDVLDVSRIESGRMVLRDEVFPFGDFLTQINTMIGGQCVNKGLTYLPRVIGAVGGADSGDAMMLKEVAFNNHNRIGQFTQQYAESPQQFLESEKERVDAFMKIYPQTIIVSSVLMAVGVGLFAFCSKPTLRASALVLMLTARSSLQDKPAGSRWLADRAKAARSP